MSDIHAAQSDIHLQLEFDHPPDRLWRALTDQEVLPKWLAHSDLAPIPGATFHLEPITGSPLAARVAGEVLAVADHSWLRMRWQAPDRTTVVDWVLEAAATGTRLTWRESPIAGQWAAAARAELAARYERLLTTRLAAVLEWLAFPEADFAAAPPAGGGTGRARVGPRPGWWAFVGAGLVAALGVASIAAGAVTLTGPPVPSPATVFAPAWPAASARTTAPDAAPQPPSAAGNPAPAPSPTAQAARTPRPSPSPRPRGEETVTPSAAPTAQLSAEYATVGTALFGYRGEITLSNRGPVPAADWSVTVTLPDSTSTIASVSGADHWQEGRTVTFTGPSVPAGGSLRFVFDVRGAPLGEKAPASCAVAGQPCAGL